MKSLPLLQAPMKSRRKRRTENRMSERVVSFQTTVLEINAGRDDERQEEKKRKRQIRRAHRNTENALRLPAELTRGIF